MPNLQTDQERGFFRVWVKRLDTLYDGFEKRLADHISAEIALGKNQRQVIGELQENLDNGQSIFRELLSGVEREMDYGLNLEYQVSSNVPSGPLPEGFELVKWTLDPAAEHCDSCLYQASLPARDIATVPIPGTQPTHGETNCVSWCKCSLVPVVALQTEAA